MAISDMPKEGDAALKRKKNPEPGLDKGAHYRNDYLGEPFDVYRAIRIFKITDPTAQHMFKKIARGTRKGHTVEELVDELQCCLTRWRELNAEDRNAEDGFDVSNVLDFTDMFRSAELFDGGPP